MSTLVFATGNLWVKMMRPLPVPACTWTLTPRVWVCYAMGMGTLWVIYPWVGVDFLIESSKYIVLLLKPQPIHLLTNLYHLWHWVEKLHTLSLHLLHNLPLSMPPDIAEPELYQLKAGCVYVR